jgi:Ser/Thr protein kinase RdoA (MazF antagonist)
VETAPVTYSSISPDYLLKLVKEKYKVSKHIKITFIKRGFNDTYLITEPTGKKFILRVYNNNRHTLESITNEIVMLCIMKTNHNHYISYPIPTTIDGLIVPIMTPEGQRWFVLFSYAEGQPVRKLSTEQSFLLGAATAKIHKDVRMFYKFNATYYNYEIAQQFNTTLTTLKPILKNFPEQYNYLKELKADFIKTFKEANKKELKTGICHGDLQAENIHFTEDNKLTIFDFDFMGKGYLMYDIGVFMWYDHKNKPKEIIDSFIKGYETERKLSATELRLLPYFSTLRAVFQMTLYCQTNNGQYLPQWQPKDVAAFVNKIKDWHSSRKAYIL